MGSLLAEGNKKAKTNQNISWLKNAFLRVWGSGIFVQSF